MEHLSSSSKDSDMCWKEHLEGYRASQDDAPDLEAGLHCQWHRIAVQEQVPRPVSSWYQKVPDILALLADLSTDCQQDIACHKEIQRGLLGMLLHDAMSQQKDDNPCSQWTDSPMCDTTQDVHRPCKTPTGCSRARAYPVGTMQMRRW